ncbi:LysM domain containing protein [Sarcoptes scabiei]|uniref:LysM domain containing protein n=1 Tax=Sarcoptes scabiei TaxID=52283 RepID=A0A132AJV4_SARSC|nr:LysM domain containing protein [Sarcoptes scabiei]
MYQRLINEDDDHKYHDRNAYEFKNLSSSNDYSRRTSHETYSFFGINPNKNDWIEHKIIANDTLQGIALRYNCSITQLKRINHIRSDQDFYVLKVIRVPVMKHGIFTELNDQDVDDDVNAQQKNCQLIDFSNDQNSQSVATKTQVIQIGISKYLNKDQHDEKMTKFLDNLKTDLEEIRRFNESKMDSDLILTTSSTTIDNDQNRQDNLEGRAKIINSCDGSDFGIQWNPTLYSLQSGTS